MARHHDSCICVLRNHIGDGTWSMDILQVTTHSLLVWPFSAEELLEEAGVAFLALTGFCYEMKSAQGICDDTVEYLSPALSDEALEGFGR